MDGPAKILPRWQKREPILASKLNQSLDAIQDLSSAPRSTPEGGNRIFWVRLTEWIGPADNFVDRAAVLQFYDTSTDQWTDTSPEQDRKVTDPTGQLCYPQDSIIPCLAHSSGHLIPLAGNATILLGKTTSAVTAGTATTGYQIWTGTLGSETDSGVTTVPDALSRIAIDSGKFVNLLQLPGGGWLMVPLECNG